MTELDEIDEMAGTKKGDQEMTDGKCPFCGAALHFSDEVGMFCPACVQGGAFNIANEAAKQRRASDIALAATEAERVARALRGEVVPLKTPTLAEQMPPPFAVCEGHAARLAALEGRVAALEVWWKEEQAEDDELNAIADERAGQPVATLCPVVTRVEVRDHFGRVLFFAFPADDVDLRYSDDGKTMTVVLKR